MKKSIKILLLATLLVGGAIFGYAKQLEKKWLCEVGTIGWCIYDNASGEAEYSCMIPTETPPNGDCKGMREVIMPQ